MIQAVKGAKDILPGNVELWQYAQSKIQEICSVFNYRELRTPIFEKTEVFSRSIGEATDIVNKEMYTFTDRGGESITLRPEMTAALVRSVIESSMLAHNPLLRLWYFGPFFRYERPQKGRLRQFHQFGAECIGSEHPESDVETILLAHNVLKALGINKYKLMINSLGNKASRMHYREKLIEYLESHKEKLSYETRQRLDKNPLRALDSKEPEDKAVVENAPSILDYLDEESKTHFDTVVNSLKELNIDFEINPALVRGLDYYSHTVYEFQHDALGAQDSFGGGGRYNELFEQLGGKQAPAVGFAMGVERLLLILEALNVLKEVEETVDVYVIAQNSSLTNYAFAAANNLRQKGFRTAIDLKRRSFKAQFKEANRLKAKFAVIIGDDEKAEKALQVKDLQSGVQEKVPADKASDYIFGLYGKEVQE